MLQTTRQRTSKQFNLLAFVSFTQTCLDQINAIYKHGQTFGSRNVP